jgi:hypothetical protein
VEAQVATLLKDSMAAHAQWRMLKPTQPEQASAALRSAAALRVQAHEADPDHSDPAWQQEQPKTARGRDTHEELMAFYRAQGVL